MQTTVGHGGGTMTIRVERVQPVFQVRQYPSPFPTPIDKKKEGDSQPPEAPAAAGPEGSELLGVVGQAGYEVAPPHLPIEDLLAGGVGVDLSSGSFGGSTRQGSNPSDYRSAGGDQQPSQDGKTPPAPIAPEPPADDLTAIARQIAAQAPGLNVESRDSSGRRLFAAGPQVRPLSAWERLRNFVLGLS